MGVIYSDHTAWPHGSLPSASPWSPPRGIHRGGRGARTLANANYGVLCIPLRTGAVVCAGHPRWRSHKQPALLCVFWQSFQRASSLTSTRLLVPGNRGPTLLVQGRGPQSHAFGPTPRAPRDTCETPGLHSHLVRAASSHSSYPGRATTWREDPHHRATRAHIRSEIPRMREVESIASTARCILFRTFATHSLSLVVSSRRSHLCPQQEEGLQTPRCQPIWGGRASEDAVSPALLRTFQHSDPDAPGKPTRGCVCLLFVDAQNRSVPFTQGERCVLAGPLERTHHFLVFFARTALFAGFEGCNRTPQRHASRATPDHALLVVVVFRSPFGSEVLLCVTLDFHSFSMAF